MPKALNHVKASVEFVEGRVTVEWTKENGKFRLLLDIPNGVSVTVVLPDGRTYSGHARHQEWTCGLPGWENGLVCAFWTLMCLQIGKRTR